MEIGPITGIRPLTAIKPKRAAEDLSAVFAVEFGQEREETYTPKQQSASRGLEDDDTVTLGEDDAEDQGSFVRAGEGAVNFFA